MEESIVISKERQNTQLSQDPQDACSTPAASPKHSNAYFAQASAYATAAASATASLTQSQVQKKTNKNELHELAARKTLDLSDPSDFQVIQQILMKEGPQRSKLEIDIIYKVFSKIQFFAEMEKEVSAKQIKNLIRSFEYETTDARHPIFHQGQQGTKFYVILKGSVWVLVPNKFSSSTSQDQITESSFLSKNLKACSEMPDDEFLSKVYPIFNNIATLHSGQSFGEIALRQRTMRTATIVAKEPVILATITRNVFNLCVSQYYRALRDSEIYFLQRFQIFSDLYKQDIESILISCVKQTYLKNHVIFQENQPADTIYFLQSGEIHLTKAIDIFAEDANDLYTNRESGLKAASLPKRTPKGQIPEGPSPPPLATVKSTKKSVSLAYIQENSLFGEEEAFCGRAIRETKAIVTSQTCTFYSLKMQDFMQLMVKRFTADHIARIKSECLHSKILIRQENFSKLIEVNQIFSNFQSRLDEENLRKQKGIKKLLFEGKRPLSSSQTTSTSTPTSPRKSHDFNKLTAAKSGKEIIPKHSQKHEGQSSEAQQNHFDLFCITSPPEDQFGIHPSATQEDLQTQQQQQNHLYQSFASLNTEAQKDQKERQETSQSFAKFVCPPSMDLEKLNLFYSPKKSTKRKCNNKHNNQLNKQNAQAMQSETQPQQQQQQHSVRGQDETEFIRKSTMLSCSQKNLIILSMNKEKKQQDQTANRLGNGMVLRPSTAMATATSKTNAATINMRTSRERPVTATTATSSTSSSNNRRRKYSEDPTTFQKRESNPLWDSMYISSRNQTDFKSESVKDEISITKIPSSSGKPQSPVKKRPVSAQQATRVPASGQEKKVLKLQQPEKRMPAIELDDFLLDSTSPILSECDEVEQKLLKNIVVNSLMHKDSAPVKHGIKDNWALTMNNNNSLQSYAKPINHSVASTTRPSTAGRMFSRPSSSESTRSMELSSKSTRVQSASSAVRKKNDMITFAAVKDWNETAQEQVRKKQASVVKAELKRARSHQVSSINTPAFQNVPVNGTVVADVAQQQQQQLNCSNEGFSKKRAGAFNAGKYFLNGTKQQKYFFNLRQKFTFDLINSDEVQLSTTLNSNPFTARSQIRAKIDRQEQFSRIESEELSEASYSSASVIDKSDKFSQKIKPAEVAVDKAKGDQLDKFKQFIKSNLYSSS